MSAYNQPSPYHQGHKPSKKEELLNGLSVSVALYLTLWVWPAFYGFTVTYAETHIIENFGYQFLFVGKIAHGLAVGAVTYFGYLPTPLPCATMSESMTVWIGLIYNS